MPEPNFWGRNRGELNTGLRRQDVPIKGDRCVAAAIVNESDLVPKPIGQNTRIDIAIERNHSVRSIHRGFNAMSAAAHTERESINASIPQCDKRIDL